MAKAYKCDRCGEYFNICPDVDVIVSKKKAGNVDKIEFNIQDLCQNCHDELIEWWEVGRWAKKKSK